MIDSLHIEYNGNIVNSATNKEIPCRIWYKPSSIAFTPKAAYDFTGIVLKLAFPNEIYILEKFEKVQCLIFQTSKALKKFK
jgi:hypothetical protein